MIDNETMMLLARFAFAVRKLDRQVDSNLLLNDANYRTEIFKFVDTHGDENLLMLCLSVQNKLGLINATNNINAPTTPITPAATPAAAAPTDSGKYVRGARG